MLATALIVFRELLEASLIVTILLASTNGVARRGFWVSLGVGGGLIGAGMVAAMIGQISDMFQGTGQELVNAAILFLAVGLIGWHVVWMNAHGKQMAADMRQAGRRVTDGDHHMSTLAIIAALAVMREGSELVLMIHGLMAGETASSIYWGAGMGLVAGIMFSILMYWGLLAMPVSKIFVLTNGLLILIAAGMAARGANFLAQSGYLPIMGDTVWDSERLLSEQSIVGQILTGLVGYMSRPTGIQILFYLVTAASIFFFMRQAQKNAAKQAMVAVVVLLALVCAAVPAFAVDKIYSPNVVKGEWELEYFGTRTFDKDPAKDNNQAHEFSVGYGVTNHWATEFYGLMDKPSQDALRFSGFEWENRFSLFEPGEYWVDPGLLVAYTHNLRNEETDALEVKLLFEKQTEHFLHRLNAGIEQAIGPHVQDGPERTVLWSSRYLLNEHLEPGFEWQSNFGTPTEHKTFKQQEHVVGPALYGIIVPHLKYEAAYLFGVTEGAAKGTAKLLLEYEMYF